MVKTKLILFFFTFIEKMSENLFEQMRKLSKENEHKHHEKYLQKIKESAEEGNYHCIVEIIEGFTVVRYLQNQGFIVQQSLTPNFYVIRLET